MRVVSVDFHCVFECVRVRETKLSDLQLKTHLSAVPELEELQSCLCPYIQRVPKTSVHRVPSKSADISSWSAELILCRQDRAPFTAQLVLKKAHVDRFQGCTRAVFSSIPVCDAAAAAAAARCCDSSDTKSTNTLSPVFVYFEG